MYILKHCIFLIFISLLFLEKSRGQPLTYQYAESWGTPAGGYDYGKSIAVGVSGNIFVAGTYSASIDLDPGGSAFLTPIPEIYYNDFFIAKYNSSGSFVWAITFAGTYPTPNSLTVDASDNVYVTGYFSGTVDFDPSTGTQNLTSVGGSNDIFIAKYDANGNYLFAKSMGGTSSENPYEITIDAALNIYITGSFSGTSDFDPGVSVHNLTSNGGNSDIFFAKYDAGGNYLWANSIGGTYIYGSNYGKSIAVDAGDNVYITGNFTGTNVDFDPGAGTQLLSTPSFTVAPSYTFYRTDIYLAKYSSTGTYLWANAIKGDSSYSYSNSVKVDGASNAYIAGQFSKIVDFDPGAGTQNLTTTSAGNDAYFAKYDASGGFVWVRQIAGTGYESSTTMTLDASGNILLTGLFNQTADFDPGAGTQNLSTSPVTDYNLFVAKYTSAGNYMWAFGAGSTANSDYSRGIAADASDNIYITGDFTGTADFDPGAAVQNVTAKVSESFFVAKYDQNGNYGFAFTSDEGNGGDDYPGQMAVDNLGNTYMVGYFYGTIDFDAGPGVHTLQALSSGTWPTADIVLAKYDASGDYVWANKIGNTGDEYSYVLALDASNNVYIAGSYTDTVDFDPGGSTNNLSSGFAGYSDAFLAKYDANGNYIWAKCFPAANTTTYSGISGLTIDASGNAYLTGYFHGTIDMDPGASVQNLSNTTITNFETFIAKYDASGNYAWAKKLTSGTASSYSASIGVVVDASGNCYTSGYFAGTVDFDPAAGTQTRTTGANGGTFIAKYSSTGSYTWANKIETTSTINYIISYAIAKDTSNNIYITGYFYGTADLDPGAGTHNLTSTASSSEIFFAKYDSSGSYVLATALHGTQDGYPVSITTDASQSIFLAGVFYDQVDFDPGAGTQHLTSNGGDGDIFIAKYDVSGNYVLALKFGGTTYDQPTSVVTNALGDTVYILGFFTNSNVDFDPGASTHALTSLSGNDMFIAKYAITPSNLPVELFEFKATLKNKQVELDWSTASEINNDFFTIEKTMDGINYEIVGKIKGAGNSVKLLNYQLIDSMPYFGTSYYRLKQTDFDGKFKYSKLVSVQFQQDNDFINVYPNPCEGNLFILFTDEISTDTKIYVKDVAGRELVNRYYVLPEGKQLLSIVFDNDVPPGIYFLTGIINTEVFSKKIVIR